MSKRHCSRIAARAISSRPSSGFRRAPSSHGPSTAASPPLSSFTAKRKPRIALSLSGGLALGAYQAGAYAALHESGLRPDRIAGCSIGAINGAIIAGNPAERRIDQLARFWEAAVQSPPWPPSLLGQGSYRHASALWTRLLGHPQLFRARFHLGLSPFSAVARESGFYDLQPLRQLLESLVDFKRLNEDGVHLTVTAVDMASGEEVRFETGRERIGVAHLMASAAFTPDFLPVEIDGRLLGDGALASNVPLRAALDDASSEDLLCFLIDLFHQKDDRASSGDQAFLRHYELIFSNQCRRQIEAQQEICELRRLIWHLGAALPLEVRRSRKIAAILKQGSERAIGLLHLAHRPSANEGPLRVFDFSQASLAERWRAGAADMARALAIAADLVNGPRRPGLSVHEVPSLP
jgi:NTE family protein